MKLSDILLLLKGKRAAVGEIRNWKGGSYIKTVTGWKPHEKQYSKKYTERKNNAATKKDSDLRNRQSEVARLSGEIQGHKAAVEHHTAQNTKQDIRQAKHHAIRAQVKQRRLDKHKEILEQRHGVKDEVQKPVIPKKVQDAKDLSGDLKEMTSRMEKQQATETENFKPFTETKDRVLGHALYKEYQNIYKDSPLLLDKKNQSDFIELNKNSFSENTDTGKLQLDKKIILPKKQTPVKSPEAKANFEKWKAERQEEKPTTPQEQPKPKGIPDLYDLSELDSRDKIFNEIKHLSEDELNTLAANVKKRPNYNTMAMQGGLQDAYKALDGKPKENAIQSGSRGATIAGQQYSKREVDILNSLDDIINRAKSPVVQDLLKKRQAAKVELPSKELGQPKTRSSRK